MTNATYTLNDSQSVKDFSNALDALLREFCSEHGLTLKPGSYRYSGGVCKVAHEFVAGTGEEALRAEWIRNASAFIGIGPEHYGATVTVGGRQFKLHSLKPRARKFGVVGKCLKDGRLYKLTDMEVARALSSQGVTP